MAQYSLTYLVHGRSTSCVIELHSVSINKALYTTTVGAHAHTLNSFTITASCRMLLVLTCYQYYTEKTTQASHVQLVVWSVPFSPVPCSSTHCCTSSSTVVGMATISVVVGGSWLVCTSECPSSSVISCTSLGSQNGRGSLSSWEPPELSLGGLWSIASGCVRARLGFGSCLYSCAGGRAVDTTRWLCIFWLSSCTGCGTTVKQKNSQ